MELEPEQQFKKFNSIVSDFFYFIIRMLSQNWKNGGIQKYQAIKKMRRNMIIIGKEKKIIPHVWDLFAVNLSLASFCTISAHVHVAKMLMLMVSD